MAQVKITFEDPNSPGNPGIERTFAEDTTKVTTDHGCVAVGEVQAGWRMCRTRESWCVVHAVETLA